MVWVSVALAWQSQCFTGQSDPEHAGEPEICADGYHKARNRYVLPEGVSGVSYSTIRNPEHAWIWDVSADRAGLPSSLVDDMELKTYIKPEELGVEDFTSIRPRREGVEKTLTRTLRASEMTQLPDMSFSLWDWAMGNEVCPLDENLDVQECHRFDKHMGGLNSSHFLPQSEGFYRWYHDLALARAEQCAQAHDELAGLYPDRPDLKTYVLECERSAMVLYELFFL